jgi:hypothetical protein
MNVATSTPRSRTPLVLLLAAVVSVMLRLVVQLYGPAHLRATRAFDGPEG